MRDRCRTPTAYARRSTSVAPTGVRPSSSQCRPRSCRSCGHIGTLPVNDLHDDAATYAILYGYADDPHAWLRAGLALSDVWLTTTAMNIALLPLSAAVEAPRTRQLVNRLLAGIGYAQIAVRLAIPDPAQGAAPRTPRLPTAETIERE